MPPARTPAAVAVDEPEVADETSIDPSRLPLDAFGLPSGTQRYLIQLPTRGLDGTTQLFSVFVHNGVVIDGGERAHRWSIGKSWLNAREWFVANGGHGKLHETTP